MAVVDQVCAVRLFFPHKFVCADIHIVCADIHTTGLRPTPPPSPNQIAKHPPIYIYTKKHTHPTLYIYKYRDGTIYINQAPPPTHTPTPQINTLLYNTHTPRNIYTGTVHGARRAGPRPREPPRLAAGKKHSII